jgi:cytochrome bd-type quinol oxidase subunit 1
MKAYLVTTSTLFSLLALVHLWRVIEERSSLGRDPWFLIITIIAAALAAWGISLLRRPSAA